MQQASEACRHTVCCTDEDGGSSCVDCGVKVCAVHDQPCSGCRHYRLLIGGSICRRHLMRVTPDMHVTYKIGKPAREGGLCFELCANPGETRV